MNLWEIRETNTNLCWETETSRTNENNSTRWGTYYSTGKRHNFRDCVTQKRIEETKVWPGPSVNNETSIRETSKLCMKSFSKIAPLFQIETIGKIVYSLIIWRCSHFVLLWRLFLHVETMPWIFMFNVLRYIFLFCINNMWMLLKYIN